MYLVTVVLNIFIKLSVPRDFTYGILTSTANVHFILLKLLSSFQQKHAHT